jgi:hypothetical protein
MSWLSPAGVTLVFAFSPSHNNKIKITTDDDGGGGGGEYNFKKWR